jgi:hypothetical protein
MLSRKGAVRQQSLGVIYELPNGLKYKHGMPSMGANPHLEGGETNIHVQQNA